MNGMNQNQEIKWEHLANLMKPVDKGGKGVHIVAMQELRLIDISESAPHIQTHFTDSADVPEVQLIMGKCATGPSAIKEINNLPPEERIKAMCSHIKNAAGCKQETRTKATHITMDFEFEGFQVKAEGESNISTVLSAHTELVSIDETTPKTHIKHNLKQACTEYNDSAVENAQCFDSNFYSAMNSTETQ